MTRPTTRKEKLPTLSRFASRRNAFGYTPNSSGIGSFVSAEVCPDSTQAYALKLSSLRIRRTLCLRSRCSTGHALCC
jgi:hypothetical protein